MTRTAARPSRRRRARTSRCSRRPRAARRRRRPGADRHRRRTLDPSGIRASDALDRVSAAVRDALADGPLERDDFHQALRERLPEELLWWCRGCQSHHVHPSLWRATGIRGVLAVVERARPRDRVRRAAEAARRQGAPARAGPPLPARLRAGDRGDWPRWAGSRRRTRARCWPRRGRARRGRLRRRRAVLAADADARRAGAARRAAAPDARPVLASADREDARARTGRPQAGVDRHRRARDVLVDGDVAGLWRPQKKGKRLVVERRAAARLEGVPSARSLAAEAERLAPFRGRRVEASSRYSRKSGSASTLDDVHLRLLQLPA